MKHRFIQFKVLFFAGILSLGLSLNSCEKYLDKAPDANISEKDVFTNFVSFQGFVEEMYNCVTDPNKAGAWNQFLFADETLNNSPYPFDQGNYWNQGSLHYQATAVTDGNSRSKRIWPLCWYGIRKANMALSKIDLMTAATDEERNLIKGQAYFFRGFFYFELMRWWGGLPYLDKVLSATEEMKYPRLSYQDLAAKIAKDFEQAAALLPVDWDQIPAGQRTLGNNRQRISKIMALSYLGKNYLYAGSPMMNESSTGKNEFNVELCKKAAIAFGETIKQCDQSGMFKLQSWATWTDNFWVWSPGNNTMSGGTEVIMNCTVFDKGRVRWSTVGATCPVEMGGNSSSVEVPTHNYVKNYAMANGLPIDDPASGFNPNDPWTGREPRFYKDITIDGEELVASSAAGADRYAQLYNGGKHKGGSKGSTSGYYYKRWSPKGCNQWEKKWDNFQSYVPYMRLADVYLMYAEAVLQGYGTAASTAEGYTLTAEQAINAIRNRAQLPNLNSKYTSSKEAFMGEIIRERAVELAFEGHRFHDLRRWNLNSDPRYLNKTAIDFDRGTNGKPINLKERVVITRVAEKKHNWLPFQVNFTMLYKDFPQNPGW